MSLTHINKEGRARMVDVSDKNITKRVAKAQAIITMKKATLNKIIEGEIKKGDVLAVAQVAGIQASKLTAQLIPMCHPLALNHVDLSFEPDFDNHTLKLVSTISTEGKTGVEMEALTCVNLAALTVYDMCKSIDKAMRIDSVYLLEKQGGKSGAFRYKNLEEEN